MADKLKHANHLIVVTKSKTLNNFSGRLRLLTSVTIIMLAINVNLHVHLTSSPFDMAALAADQTKETFLNLSFDIDLSGIIAPTNSNNNKNQDLDPFGPADEVTPMSDDVDLLSEFEPSRESSELNIPKSSPSEFEEPCILNYKRMAFHCKGFIIRDIPQYLDIETVELHLKQVSVAVIRRHSLSRYSDFLVEFVIIGAPELETIEPGAFSEFPKLGNIRIRETGLRVFPDFSELTRLNPKNSEHPIFFDMIDLQANQIETLGDKPLKLKAAFLRLANNVITEIPSHILNNSEIGTLDLSSNKELKVIHEFAFTGLMNLASLTLSATSIERLPTDGLGSLKTLVIQNTRSLKTIPTIYQFPELESAALTYPSHCCAFHNPAQHDPKAHEEHKQKQAEIDQECDIQHATSSGQDQNVGTLKTMSFEESLPTTSTSETSKKEISGRQVGNQRKSNNQVGDVEEIDLRVVRCGKLTNRFGDQQILVNCTPEHDVLNPCEDILKNRFLRHIIWPVLALAILGNLAVIIVLGSVFNRLTVPRFLQLNLALGDLFTGIYLLMLASADYVSRGTYFNWAFDWQEGLGCKLAGSANLFASQLSIFTLSVITFERFFTITNTIDLNMRLKLSWASRIMLIGWLYAIGSALLPIWADISSYSVSSICLPLRTNTKADLIYVLTLISIKTIAFFILIACYLRMYFLIVAQETEANFHERRVAKRMALLVFTDFACYAPIIFFAITALLDMPLISIANTKYLIVFIYPLNSVANPFLYVISTRQYKRDLNYLGRRLSIWWRNLVYANQQNIYIAYGDQVSNMKQLQHQQQQLNNNNHRKQNKSNNLQIANSNQPGGFFFKLTGAPNNKNLATSNQQTPERSGGNASRFKRPSMDHFRFDLIAAEGARRKKMMKAQRLMDEKHDICCGVDRRDREFKCKEASQPRVKTNDHHNLMTGRQVAAVGEPQMIQLINCGAASSSRANKEAAPQRARGGAPDNHDASNDGNESEQEKENDNGRDEQRQKQQHTQKRAQLTRSKRRRLRCSHGRHISASSGDRTSKCMAPCDANQICETRNGADKLHVHMPGIVVNRDFGERGNSSKASEQKRGAQKADKLNGDTNDGETKINKNRKSRGVQNAGWHLARRIDILGNLSPVEATSTTTTVATNENVQFEEGASRLASNLNEIQPRPSDARPAKCRRHRRASPNCSHSRQDLDHNHHRHQHQQKNQQDCASFSNNVNKQHRHHHNHHHRDHHHERCLQINSAVSSASNPEAFAAAICCWESRPRLGASSDTGNQVNVGPVNVGAHENGSNNSDMAKKTNETEASWIGTRDAHYPSLDHQKQHRHHGNSQHDEQQNGHEPEQNVTLDSTCSTLVMPGTTTEMLTMPNAKAKSNSTTRTTNDGSGESVGLIGRKAGLESSKCNKQSLKSSASFMIDELLVYSIGIDEDVEINIAKSQYEPIEINRADAQPAEM